MKHLPIAHAVFLVCMTIAPGAAASISGLLFVATPGMVAYAQIYDGTSNDPLSFTYLPSVLQTGTVSGSNLIGLNVPVLAYFNPRDQPTIVFQTTTPMSAAGALPPSGISLSGYYVNLP